MIISDPRKKQKEKLMLEMAQALNQQAFKMHKADRQETARMLYRKALTYSLQAGDSEEAEQVKAGLNYHLAGICYESGHTKKGIFYGTAALEKYREMARRDQDRWRIQIANTLESLALLYIASDDLEHERECYAELLSHYSVLEKRAAPSFARQKIETLNRLAFCDSKAKRFHIAEAEYAELVEMITHTDEQHFTSPRDVLLAVAYEDNARMIMVMGEPYRAKEWFDRAIKTITPHEKQFRSVAARILDGRAHCEMKCSQNHMQALHFIDMAIELDPTDADWYDTRGQIMLRLGMREQAFAMWDKVMKIEPNHREINGSELYDALFVNPIQQQR